MNTNLLKYYLKKDLRITAGYIFGISVTMFVMGLVLDFSQPLSSYIIALNASFPYVAFGVFLAIYLPILNKTTADQWENFSLTNSEKFNLLANRYIISMLIPQIVLSVWADYLTYGSNPSMIWSFIPLILLPLMNFVFGMYFVFVSGHASTAVIGVILSSAISEVILSTKDWTKIDARVLWSVSFIGVCLMYFINKKIFSKRQVEKLGKMFMFRWAEIVFTIGITFVVGFIMNIIKGLNGIAFPDYIYITLLMVLAYILFDTLFITGFKIEKLKAKLNIRNVCIQIGIGVVLSVVVNVACIYLL